MTGDPGWDAPQAPPAVRPDLRPVAAAVGIGLASAVLGLRAGDALLIGMAVLGLGAVWVSLSAGRSYAWAESLAEETDGTRQEVYVLTWSFARRDGPVSEAGVRRLREVTARRLARNGLPGVVLATPPPGTDLDPGQELLRQRARELLGDRAWATVSGRGGWLPSLDDVSHCVDVLERLAPDAGERAPT